METLTSSKAIADMVMEKGKIGAAAFINEECMTCDGHSASLDALLDVLLDPNEKIDDPESIDWCRWLIAGGRTPSEFSSIVRGYDNHAKCGLVWIPHVVAYRCRTCGISPCMSICRNCFKKGDHSTHDFNMFLSQAGGACDCGDTSVMKAEGFCSDHGINDRATKLTVPYDLMCVAEAIMPRLLIRLLQHFRNNGVPRRVDRSHIFNTTAKYCNDYCSMLMDFNNMGELMRRVMTKALINSELYKSYLEPPFPKNDYGKFLANSKRKYEDAVHLFPSPEPPDEYKHLPALSDKITHSTLLEEFIFWTFKFEFPQNIVCFLLNMLPDQDYKEHLTRTFVMHYSRIPTVLERSSDPDTLSNRFVHMSVQLFSNENLALKMVEELNLLHVMIISLKLMMSKILIQNTLHDTEKNFHYVIDCAKRVMKEHCYWPLVSDFNNVLSHESVALVFLRDDDLVDMWFQFLSMLQGMNVNVRETASHVEFEPSSYYAAFSCELEASAYPMWSIISHLKDSTHSDLAKKILDNCKSYLDDWLEAIYFYQPKIEKSEMTNASFHFPLHRYLAAFTAQAVQHMGIPLKDILPQEQQLKLLMMHPLRVQSLFYEILAGIWVRNGLQIKGQAMTYIQANFCNSMIDMDLFFLQLCATHLPAHSFLTTAIEVFGVNEWLGMGSLVSSLDSEQDVMLEGLLTFLATIVTSRTNLGNTEAKQCIIEISALLATGDKTHSQLLELMPERSGSAHSRNFEKFLKTLSVYRRPLQGSENLEQGLFTPIADVWEKYYDPLHVLLRAVHRRDFQCSMDRFGGYVKQQNRMPKSGNLWPPFRLPQSVGAAYSDPACILNSRVLHATLFGIFYRAIQPYNNVSEHLLALAVFLLEMAVTFSENNAKSTVLECHTSKPHCNSYRNDREYPELINCYPGDCLSENLRLVITKLSLAPPEPQVSPANYSTTTFDSDLEWDVSSETDTLPMLGGSSVTGELENNSFEIVAASTNMEVAEPEDLSLGHEQSLVLRNQSSLRPTSSEIAIAEGIHPLNNLVGIGTQLALPPSGISVSGMEVAIRQTANEMFNANHSIVPGMLLPFQRVQPVSIPSRTSDVIPSNVTTARRLCVGGSSKKRFLECSSSSSMDSDNTIAVNESIISLLLKLHSHLSGTLDSFSLEEPDENREKSSNIDGKCNDFDIDMEAGTSTTATSDSEPLNNFSTESRIGDGPFFIGKLLRKIAHSDEKCAQNINEIRQKLWPNQRERQAEQKAKEQREKEERTKRAKERQQKLMDEFANRQKQFMEQSIYSGVEMDIAEDEDLEIEQPREKEYDCIICNTTSASTDSNPVCLVVLVESTSVIGHRKKSSNRIKLPLSEIDKVLLEKDTSFFSTFNRRIELLSSKFGESSWYISNNLSWEGGVYLQSCGHHVHLACHESYLNSLYSSQRPQNLNVERGEFLCPVCRQLSNSVLPLSSQLDRPTPIIRAPPPSFTVLVKELMVLIKENERPPTSTKLSEAMGRAMEDMTNITHRKFKTKRVSPTFQSLFLFVTSIARTNLESEIVQRNGSLVTNSSSRYKPRRDCIVPLLHVLSVHVRVLIEWPVWRTWANICGIPLTEESPTCSNINDMISILSDPCAMMLKFILLAPLHLDLAHFSCIVKITYNLLYYQIVVQMCMKLSEKDCDEILKSFYPIDLKPNQGITNLGSALAFVLINTSRFRRYRSVYTNETSVDLNLLELELQKLCLPFLRVAGLLRHHLYRQDLPEIKTAEEEFSHLVYFLELVNNNNSSTTIIDNLKNTANLLNGADALCFLPDTEFTVPKSWLTQLMNVPPPSDDVSELIVNQHISWSQPRLLGLPKEYERLFTFYHEQPCTQCSSVPKESAICLLCGTIICLKQQCCKEQECCEAVRHSINCGGGTGIFLVITSTYIIVIRGRRACLWGSLYLDDYDEEDRDLKRGKPLYLSEDRFTLLESQWLAHRFAHTKHTWVWHRDSL